MLQITLHKQMIEKQEYIYHAISWGVPAIFVVCSAPFGVFGASGAWYGYLFWVIVLIFSKFEFISFFKSGVLIFFKTGVGLVANTFY